jgi:protein-tyrosine-phosphatase
MTTDTTDDAEEPNGTHGPDDAEPAGDDAAGRERTTLTFMCVRNAGRSQMATAFAERERRERGLENDVEIITGGTAPADAVHDVVIEALAEVSLAVNGRTPRRVSEATLAASDFVATMGCSTLELPGVDTDDWDLDDPGERPIEEVRPIRDEIERRVVALFDERFGKR